MEEDAPRSRPSRRRLGGIIALALGLGLSLLGWWVYRELQPERLRPRLEEALSSALNRKVTIARVDMGLSTLRLEDVTIENPRGYPGKPLMTLERASLDVEVEELLDRRLVGDISLSGVELRVVKRGGRTNLHGMLDRAKNEEKGKPPAGELDLEVRVEDANVVLEDAAREDRFVLRDVELTTHLTRKEVRPKFDVSATIGRVELGKLALANVRTRVRVDRPSISVRSFEGEIVPSGQVVGSGRINLAQSRAPLWNFELEVRDAKLEGPITELVSAGFPPLLLSLASVEEGSAIEGTVEVDADLRGRGLAWPTIRPTLAGTVDLKLRDVVMPTEALLVELGTLAGRKAERWSAKQAGAKLEIAKGWVQPKSVRWGANREIPVEGRVALDGRIDLEVDIMPLVGRIESKALDRLSSLPIHVGGTLERPELRPPSVEEVGVDVVGNLIREGLPKPSSSPERRKPRQRERSKPRQRERR